MISYSKVMIQIVSMGYVKLLELILIYNIAKKKYTLARF